MFTILTLYSSQDPTPAPRAVSPSYSSTSPNYTPEPSPIYTIHPGPKPSDAVTRKLAEQKTQQRAEAMRKQLDDNMRRDDYAPFYREAASDTLHLWYALLVMEQAWLRGVPAELEELVDQMRRDVKRATCDCVMAKFQEAMQTPDKPRTFPDEENMDVFQTYMVRQTAEIARSIARVDLVQHTEMLAALNADMNKDERPEAEQRAAVLLLPVYYAVYTMQSSFAHGQPYDVLHLAQAMADSVDRCLVTEIYKENLADGATVAGSLPLTSHVRATQMYCFDAVCAVLVEAD